jgi:hypothetical protein
MLWHYPNAQARFRSLFGPTSTPGTVAGATTTTTARATTTTTAPRATTTTTAPRATTTTTAPRATTTTTAPRATTTTTVAPLPVKTPPVVDSPSSHMIAARNATRNIATESRWAGAEDAPYVCCWGSQGQYVTFSFDAAGGPTSLALRYSAGNGVAQRRVEVDGAVFSANASFGATANWNTWSKKTLSTRLTPGRHTLKIWFDQNSGSHNYINLDNLTISPMLMIPARSAVTNLQTESRWSGAENTPYVCCWGSQGQYVTFSFDAVGGPTSLALRYSAGNGNAHRTLEMDGVVLTTTKTFPATANWNTWSTTAWSANLTPGRHTVKIWFDRNTGSDQYVNLDDLWVTGAAISG